MFPSAQLECFEPHRQEARRRIILPGDPGSILLSFPDIIYAHIRTTICVEPGELRHCET